MIKATVSIMLLLLILSNEKTYGQEMMQKCPLDTIRLFEKKYGEYSYINMNIKYYAVASRFFIERGSELVAVVVHTQGGKGAFRVRVFGEEHEYGVPILEQDVREPITVQKPYAGGYAARVVFDTPIVCTGTQFFICVDHIDDGIVILSDNQKVQALCSIPDKWSYHNQCIKRSSDNRWAYGECSFAIEAVVRRNTCNKPWFQWEKEFLQYSDTAAHKRNIQKKYNGISIGDINSDGFIDVLSHGKLFVNKGGKALVESPFVHQRGASLNIFMDANNDGLMDIVVAGIPDSNGVTSGKGQLYHKKEDGSFKEIPFHLDIGFPKCFVLVDYNHDGFKDIVLGYGFSDTSNIKSTPYPLRFIKNLHGKGFRYDDDIICSSLPVLYSVDGITCENYTKQEITLLFSGAAQKSENANRILRLTINLSDSAYTYKTVDCTREYFQEKTSPIMPHGFTMVDYDNDNNLDLLVAGTTDIQSYPHTTLKTAYFIKNINDRWKIDDKENTPCSLAEFNGATVWGDVDNDGNVDLITMSSHCCSPPKIYVQKSNNSFQQTLEHTGLEDVRGFSDAIVADINNDGKLDILCANDTAVFFFRNALQHQANYYGMTNFHGENIRSIAVFANGGVQYRYAHNGRGILMQDGNVFHVGLGTTPAIDSVVVVSDDGQTRTLKDVLVNAYYSPPPKAPIQTPQIDMRTSPNPFKTSVLISIMSAQSLGEIHIAVYNVDGRCIKNFPIQVLNTKEHSIEWDGKDEGGTEVSSGVYTLQLRSVYGEYIHKIVKY